MFLSGPRHLYKSTNPMIGFNTTKFILPFILALFPVPFDFIYNFSIHQQNLCSCSCSSHHHLSASQSYPGFITVSISTATSLYCFLGPITGSFIHIYSSSNHFSFNCVIYPTICCKHNYTGTHFKKY